MPWGLHGRGAAPVSGSTLGATITLDKRLPMGGGLGGGSSDAATTLIALNRLWDCRLSSAALQAIGLTLGADVPIFIHGHSAFAEGVGEQFTDVSVPPAWYLVLTPPVAVPTADIFRAPDLCRATPAMQPTEWHAGVGHNDLEPVACRLFPAVAEHLAWLRRFGDARMSGSGACCFVAFASQADALNARAQLPSGWHGFVARGLDNHPLAVEL